MNITWDSQGYTEHFGFVHRYGEDVLSLITAAPGSRIVDLGCGNGALTTKLAKLGYRVLGVDASEEMLAAARAHHSELEFIQGDATTFALNEPADVIFSNAVFHWIDADKQPLLAKNLARNLRPGGELVCEFGGYGCAERVHAALEHAFAARGLKYPRVFYFPTIGQYAPLLEHAGLRIEYAALFDRPTPQDGPDGLQRWIRMFVKAPFAALAPETQDEIMDETAEQLRPTLWQDGRWTVDYVRIRLRARRV